MSDQVRSFTGGDHGSIAFAHNDQQIALDDLARWSVSKENV